MSNADLQEPKRQSITPEMWSAYRWAWNEWCYQPGSARPSREAFAIQAMLDVADVVPRAVADRLAEALERVAPIIGNDELWTQTDRVLAEFRAVYGPREEDIDRIDRAAKSIPPGVDVLAEMYRDGPREETP